MATSWSLFSGLSRFSTVPAGRAAKASSVGAKTVNGFDRGDERAEGARADCGVDDVLGMAAGEGRSGEGDRGGQSQNFRAKHFGFLQMGMECHR